MKPQKIKYMIDAQDMDRAVKFYTETLGLESSFVSPYWSEVTFGDTIIGIHGGGDGTRKQTGLSLQYEDVQAAHNLAISAGAISIHAPKQNEGEPIILSSIADTEGNTIMLTQYTG
jgi:predicted enzyme related to lactoylglutathione lyase